MFDAAHDFILFSIVSSDGSKLATFEACIEACTTNRYRGTLLYLICPTGVEALAWNGLLRSPFWLRNDLLLWVQHILALGGHIPYITVGISCMEQENGWQRLGIFFPYDF